MKTDQDSLAREDLGCGPGKSTGGGVISMQPLLDTLVTLGSPQAPAPNGLQIPLLSQGWRVVMVEEKPPPLLFFILLHICVVTVISATIY